MTVMAQGRAPELVDRTGVLDLTWLAGPGSSREPPRGDGIVDAEACRCGVGSLPTGVSFRVMVGTENCLTGVCCRIVSVAMDGPLSIELALSTGGAQSTDAARPRTGSCMEAAP